MNYNDAIFLRNKIFLNRLLSIVINFFGKEKSLGKVIDFFVVVFFTKISVNFKFNF